MLAVSSLILSFRRVAMPNGGAGSDSMWQTLPYPWPADIARVKRPDWCGVPDVLARVLVSLSVIRSQPVDHPLALIKIGANVRREHRRVARRCGSCMSAA